MASAWRSGTLTEVGEPKEEWAPRMCAVAHMCQRQGERDEDNYMPVGRENGKGGEICPLDWWHGLRQAGGGERGGFKRGASDEERAEVGDT